MSSQQGDTWRGWGSMEDRLCPLVPVGRRSLQSSELEMAQQSSRGWQPTDCNKSNKSIPLGRSLLTFSKHFLIFYLSPPHNVHVRWVLSLPSDRREMKPVKAYCKWQDGLSGSRHKVSFPLLAQQGDLELAAYPVGLSLLICNLVSKHPSFVTGYKECRLERPSFKSHCTLC